MRKNKASHDEDGSAAKLLSMISEGETGYLQDWAKINEARNKTHSL